MNSEESATRVRVAVAGDATALARVHLASALAGFAHIFPPESPKPQLADLEREWGTLIDSELMSVLVAEIEGTVVAGVAFGEDQELAPPGYGLLSRLYVQPAYAGSGIGSRLHDRAVKKMRRDGWSRVWLWVLEGNTHGRAMYERRGWKPDPRRRTNRIDRGILEMGYVLDLAQRD
ncbi:MAG: GNAT family N-acetyltransferase [Acidimicrobiia bacterium]|nr:GNAT family N-acetyltransferase [Acidimicrobiia bacterium]MDJ0665487.1 GNAT family N-acetyltransferase [Acidimicrobiia bacterium]